MMTNKKFSNPCRVSRVGRGNAAARGKIPLKIFQPLEKLASLFQSLGTLLEPACPQAGEFISKSACWQQEILTGGTAASPSKRGHHANGCAGKAIYGPPN
ncbi:MAG TPA: hypothetical protein DCZ95_15955 [Verrucomicrobia bacterium]|nr:MAG: hypothetical protein A2X46_06800 [Lentisphaerae bacterium GWF2_57_35]HBA85577.1 hypothetical protein [Verrucomicrobiota bacterium]